MIKMVERNCWDYFRDKLRKWESKLVFLKARKGESLKVMKKTIDGGMDFGVTWRDIWVILFKVSIF